MGFGKTIVIVLITLKIFSSLSGFDKLLEWNYKLDVNEDCHPNTIPYNTYLTVHMWAFVDTTALVWLWFTISVVISIPFAAAVVVVVNLILRVLGCDETTFIV